MVDGKTQTVFSSTLKTDASKGDFKLNAELCDYLKAIQHKQKTMPRETKEYMDYVCVNAVGDLLKPDYITSKFKKLLKANEICLPYVFTICVIAVSVCLLMIAVSP